MFSKELSYYFHSVVAYIIIGLFLTVIALFLWVIPGIWNIPDSGYASVDGLFSLSPWLLMLLCPALTMHSLAEEYQTTTWLLLRSKPISLERILADKYFAALIVVIIALIPCIIHYFIVGLIAEPVWNIDTAVFFGSFCALLLLSSAFVAIGMFASSLSSNQIVALVVGITCCFVMFYGFELIASSIVYGKAANVIEWFSLHYHYMSLARGVIDIADVVYVLTIDFLFLLLTRIISTKK